MLPLGYTHAEMIQDMKSGEEKMLRQNFLIALLTLFTCVGVPGQQAVAATLNIIGGQLHGADNVNVDGKNYNVSFVDGTCAAVYGSCSASKFTFKSASASLKAAQALLDQVFLDIPGAAFDSKPQLTNGLNNSSLGWIHTPYRVLSSGVLFAGAVYNGRSESNDHVDKRAVEVADDLFGSGTQVYARWALAPLPSVVPLPAALPLYGTGIAILGVVGWRRKRSNKKLSC